MSKSKMKTLGEQDGYTVLSLDHRLFLMLPKHGTNRCIISAHGGRSSLAKANIFFVPDDTILRFYSEDMNSVLDPKIKNFYQGEAAPKEIVSEREACFDYILSKYQGKGNNNMGETYESIGRMINDEVKGLQNCLAMIDKHGKQGNIKQQNRAREYASTYRMAAVLTIRNRTFRADVNLSYVLDQVKAAAPQIQLFDCLFCRHAKGGTSEEVAIVKR